MVDAPRSPELGVGVAIIDDSKILLTKRRDFPVWCIPGGHLLVGESAIEAGLREAKEETGLEVEVTGLVGVYSMPHKWEDGSCEIILRGRPSGGELIPSTTETVDARFFSLEALPSDLIGWQRHQASDALSGRSGLLVVIDVTLNLAKLRELSARAAEGDSRAIEECLRQACAIPPRVDVVASQGVQAAR
jgi:ADP-ribose pyrophosphatase YjhB (NUDIX family)